MIIVNDKAQQINFLDERFYLVREGTYYPSVTHILDVYPKGPAFQQWLKDVGNEAKTIANRAAESGSKVHKGIEDLIEGAELTWNENLWNEEEWKGLLKFKDFYDQYKPRIITNEYLTYSDTYKYAGTTDLVCEIGKDRWIVDFKFSNAVYESYFLQLLAYKLAWEQQNPEYPIDRVGILHLKAQTRGRGKSDVMQGEGWKLIESEDSFDTLKKIWLSVLDIYYYQNPDPRPKNVIYPSLIKL